MPFSCKPFDSPWLPILEELEDGVALLAPDPWRIVYANCALARRLGSAIDELPEQRVEDVFKAFAVDGLVEVLEQLRAGEVPRAGFSHVLLPTAGTMHPIELWVRRMVFADELLVGLVVRSMAIESSSRVPVNASRRDPLTGLADRSVLLARIAALLRGDRATDRQFAVLFIDVDNFKQVNDAHGHLVGDRVLREVAQRLAGCVREGDQIVRFGGDEFVALIEHVSVRDEIQPVIERIHTALSTPIALPDGEAILSVSVGVAKATADHQTPEDVLGDADRAMYALKRAPR